MEQWKIIITFGAATIGLITAIISYIVSVSNKKKEDTQKIVNEMQKKIDEKQRKIDEMQNKQEKMQNKINIMKNFLGDVHTIYYEETDVIVLGPRFQGKSSVITALTKQWKSIQNIRSTPFFDIFTWESSEYISKVRRNSDFDIDMEDRIKARLNIYDYGGEDDFIIDALNKISHSNRYIIIFVLSSVAEATPSSKYFNLTAVQKIRNHLVNSKSTCLSAFLIFNKHDLLDRPSHNPMSFSRQLVSHHQSAIDNIEAIYGKTKDILVSAENGFGIGNFTRELLALVVDSNGKPIQ